MGERLGNKPAEGETVPGNSQAKGPRISVVLWRVASKLTEGVKSLRLQDRAGCLLNSHRFGDEL